MDPKDRSNPQSQYSRMSTTSSLIFDLKEFSQERWDNFVLVYSPLLRFWIGKKVASAAVDDVLQDCLKSIFTGIGQFQRGAKHGTFRGWLRTIVERRVADYYRSLPKEKSESMDRLDAALAPEQKDASEIEAEQQALHDVKARAMELVRQSTEEKTWQMFWLSTVEEVPTSEIARQFNVTPAAVRGAKKRVLERLRVLMVDDLNEG